MISKEEIEKVLDELNSVRPEVLNTEAKRLFEAIMSIADERDELKQMLKTRIAYTNELEKDLFENASNYVIPKQKIRDKIEELEKQKIKIEEEDIGVGFTLGENWSNLKNKIKILKELLEEGD